MSILNKLNVFNEFDQQLVNDIKLVCLTDEFLLFVTNDGLMFQYDIDDKRLQKFKPTKLIVKFVCGYDDLEDGTPLIPHFMALTDDGYVYSWGNNKDGQLGHGNTIYGDIPTPIDFLIDYIIVDICCGFDYTLALTRNGHVFAYGCNIFGQCGDNTTINCWFPTKVNLPKVTAISCGSDHSIALTENGDVFGWGMNDCGQLGSDGADKQLIPIKICVPIIKQIMCGLSNTLMLSSDGDVYFCGDTYFNVSLPIPTKINSTTKFIKIAATMHSLLNVALSTDNKCFIFVGFDEEENEIPVKELQRTEFASIDETFAFYDQLTYKTISIKRCQKRFKQLNLLGYGYPYAIKRKRFYFDDSYSTKRICFNSEITTIQNIDNCEKLVVNNYY